MTAEEQGSAGLTVKSGKACRSPFAHLGATEAGWVALAGVAARVALDAWAGLQQEAAAAAEQAQRVLEAGALVAQEACWSTALVIRAGGRVLERALLTLDAFLEAVTKGARKGVTSLSETEPLVMAAMLWAALAWLKLMDERHGRPKLKESFGLFWAKGQQEEDRCSEASSSASEESGNASAEDGSDVVPQNLFCITLAGVLDSCTVCGASVSTACGSCGYSVCPVSEQSPCARQHWEECLALHDSISEESESSDHEGSVKLQFLKAGFNLEANLPLGDFGIFGFRPQGWLLRPGQDEELGDRTRVRFRLAFPEMWADIPDELVMAAHRGMLHPAGAIVRKNDRVVKSAQGETQRVVVYQVGSRTCYLRADRLSAGLDVTAAGPGYVCMGCSCQVKPWSRNLTYPEDGVRHKELCYHEIIAAIHAHLESHTQFGRPATVKEAPVPFTASVRGRSLGDSFQGEGELALARRAIGNMLCVTPSPSKAAPFQKAAPPLLPASSEPGVARQRAVAAGPVATYPAAPPPARQGTVAEVSGGRVPVPLDLAGTGVTDIVQARSKPPPPHLREDTAQNEDGQRRHGRRRERSRESEDRSRARSVGGDSNASGFVGADTEFSDEASVRSLSPWAGSNRLECAECGVTLDPEFLRECSVCRKARVCGTCLTEVFHPEYGDGVIPFEACRECLVTARVTNRWTTYPQWEPVRKEVLRDGGVRRGILKNPSGVASSSGAGALPPPVDVSGSSTDLADARSFERELNLLVGGKDREAVLARMEARQNDSATRDGGATPGRRALTAGPSDLGAAARQLDFGSPVSLDGAPTYAWSGDDRQGEEPWMGQVASKKEKPQSAAQAPPMDPPWMSSASSADQLPRPGSMPSYDAPPGQEPLIRNIFGSDDESGEEEPQLSSAKRAVSKPRKATKVSVEVVQLTEAEDVVSSFFSRQRKGGHAWTVGDRMDLSYVLDSCSSAPSGPGFPGIVLKLLNAQDKRAMVSRLMQLGSRRSYRLFICSYTFDRPDYVDELVKFRDGGGHVSIIMDRNSLSQSRATQQETLRRLMTLEFDVRVAEGRITTSEYARANKRRNGQKGIFHQKSVWLRRGDSRYGYAIIGSSNHTLNSACSDEQDVLTLMDHWHPDVRGAWLHMEHVVEAFPRLEDVWSGQTSQEGHVRVTNTGRWPEAQEPRKTFFVALEPPLPRVEDAEVLDQVVAEVSRPWV